MLKNYLLVALRTLGRRRGYTAINVVGLALGLACCLVIFQYVAFETRFDRFHENERDLYRVKTATARPGEAVNLDEAGAFTPYGLAPALTEAVPEVLHAVRVHPEYNGAIVSSPVSPERVFEEEEVFYTDPAFLEAFSFPLVAGDAATALHPGRALLSESAAGKYFGTENPIGQTIDVAGGAEGSYRVVGVFEDVPATSHLQFDFLLPMEDLLQNGQYSNPDNPSSAWDQNNFATYVQLRPGADPAEAVRKMTAVLRDNFPEAWQEQGFVAHVGVQPLRDIHLNADVVGPSGPGGVVVGDRRTVTFFTLIGLVTLLIALVNYVNLATARALDRAREVGVRKAVGAERHQLVVQFLAESALTIGLAAVLAVGLAAALTPLVNGLTGTELTLASWVSPGFWAAFFVTLVVATLLAGLYPAFVLSSFRPAAALKGAGSSPGGLGLRRGLVVVQFAASVVLIAGTLIVSNQLRYMRAMDLGLDLEQVLTVDSPRVLPEGMDDEAVLARFTTFVGELRRLPSVRQAATSHSLPGQGFNWNGASVRRAEADPTTAIRGVATWIDTSFASLYGMELVASDGPEAFTPLPDSTEYPWAMLANETAVRSLGFESPEAALGQAIDFGGNGARIVGVFEDFDWASAHEARPNIFFGRTLDGSHISLRVGTADLPGTLAAVEAAYDRFFPGNVFTYAFADEAFDRQYRADERFATLFTLFAGLAIAIACLGLFGLASFTAQQRTKEIGVRKVLGASERSIVVLLSKDFAVLVVVAVVVAAPVTWLLMRRWLEGFAYRVDLGPGVLLVAGALAVTVALATVASQAFRAASTDPVEALRSE